MTLKTIYFGCVNVWACTFEAENLKKLLKFWQKVAIRTNVKHTLRFVIRIKLYNLLCWDWIFQSTLDSGFSSIDVWEQFKSIWERERENQRIWPIESVTNFNVIVVIDWNGLNGFDLTKFGQCKVKTFNAHLLLDSTIIFRAFISEYKSRKMH